VRFATRLRRDEHASAHVRISLRPVQVSVIDGEVGDPEVGGGEARLASELEDAPTSRPIDVRSVGGERADAFDRQQRRGRAVAQRADLAVGRPDDAELPVGATIPTAPSAMTIRQRSRTVVSSGGVQPLGSKGAATVGRPNPLPPALTHR